MDDKDDMLTAASHLYGVSTAAQLIAKTRRLNPELADMAGLLHDLFAYESGSYDDHRCFIFVFIVCYNMLDRRSKKIVRIDKFFSIRMKRKDWEI